jgi:signal transduction histidine kinase
MNAGPVSTHRPEVSAYESAVTELLRGRWLVASRAVWSSLTALALILFAAAVVARYDQLSDPPAAVRVGLTQIGLTAHAYALYSIALVSVFAVACFIIGALIAWRKPTDAMALFVSIFLLLLGALYGPNAAALEETYPRAYVLVNLVYACVIGSQVLMLFLFPDGRFVPRWTRLPVLAWTVVLLFFMLQPGEPLAAGPDILGALLLTSGLVSGVAAQIYRYVRVSTTVQRQQTKWVVFGVAAAAIGFLLLILPKAFFPTLTQPGGAGLLYDLVSETGATVAVVLIPITIGIAILRHHLWDIDFIINRTLVYGALTASTVSIYVLVVGGLGALFQGHGNGLVSLMAAGLIAILFAPLRDRLQRSVNRLLYGERDEPYAVLSRLGQRIGVALAPEAVLPAVVETVRDSLKLPYAAIVLRSDDPSSAIEVASGLPVAGVLRLPLTYQHERVGELILGPRAPGEAFGPADRRLLEDLAHQAGAAVHAVRLTADLQRSREQLITAREEERRRLRRDLHDGLGPALAAQMLKVGSARMLLPSDPETADALLKELEIDLETALKDIRRLVYRLRPPALDELGLVAAIRETAEQYRPRQAAADDSSGGESLHILVEAPGCLSPLPAAVEVAAYRIAQEGLTNVVRHASATSCLIRLSIEEGRLRIQISDDGVGLLAERRAGVGLTSMRERATELGGTFLVESPAAGGTRLMASLPLPATAGKDVEALGPRTADKNGATTPLDVMAAPTAETAWTGSVS